jgi:ATP-dependent DNA helicase RecQ
MEYLRRELDDPAAQPCGRCDNCTGRHWPDAVPAAAVAAARDRLDRPGVQIEPRRMWPSGMAALGIEVSGKIPAALSAEPGRAVGRLTDLGWGPRLRDVLAAASAVRHAKEGPGTEGPGTDGPGTDGPGTGSAAERVVPGDIIAAVVSVLAAWDWEQRPAAVVSVPSRSVPLLIEDLARRVAEIGRLPYLGSLASAGGPEPEPDPAPSGADRAAGDRAAGDRAAGDRAGPRLPHQHNSAQRLRAVWNELAVPTSLVQAVADLGGPVLLVDDRIETGWTMTVAAKLLREAGAPAVLPLALAVTA